MIEKQRFNIKSADGELEFTLLVHRIDGDVSEVYAKLNGCEVEFAYDLESMHEKLTQTYLPFLERP